MEPIESIALEASANPTPANGPSNYQVPEHEKGAEVSV